MWQMIGVLAELERSLISERTRAGVKAAKRRGVKFGRKPKLTPQQIDHARKLIDGGMRREDVAALFNVNRAPFTGRLFETTAKLPQIRERLHFLKELVWQHAEVCRVVLLELLRMLSKLLWQPVWLYCSGPHTLCPADRHTLSGQFRYPSL